jgi:hypothetical protein
MDMELKRQLIQDTKRESEELLACFKGIVESVAKMARLKEGFTLAFKRDTRLQALNI